jgi:hypothetical protein
MGGAKETFLLILVLNLFKLIKMTPILSDNEIWISQMSLAFAACEGFYKAEYMGEIELSFSYCDHNNFNLFVRNSNFKDATLFCDAIISQKYSFFTNLDCNTNYCYTLLDLCPGIGMACIIFKKLYTNSKFITFSVNKQYCKQIQKNLSINGIACSNELLSIQDSSYHKTAEGIFPLHRVGDELESDCSCSDGIYHIQDIIISVTKYNNVILLIDINQAIFIYKNYLNMGEYIKNKIVVIDLSCLNDENATDTLIKKLNFIGIDFSNTDSIIIISHKN